jgi:cation diffusion facilitator CzcD-associated flavoprotein CzcO
MNALTQFDDVLDAVIVGAGISGIAMAVHLNTECPNKRFVILERRPELGGTWDLFRYPGIRSDSDMYTMSLEGEPWLEKNTLGAGPAIKRYLGDVAGRYALIDRILFEHHVISADWHSGEGLWQLAVEAAGQRKVIRTRYLHLASGYYDYDSPYEAEIAGRESFKGTIAHPQFWPEDLDYSGKRVVVIGSGATAVTLIPAMADKVEHITMLQRTPTWIQSMPQRNPVIRAIRAVLPKRAAHKAIRWLAIRMQKKMFKEAREQPEVVSQRILDGVKTALGDKFEPVHFTPNYKPWDQRLCFVPDNDLFNAMVAGKASVVTDTIRTIDATGIKLNSGQHLPADIIVTATGLQLAVAGKIAVSRDGVPVAWNDLIFYKGCMLSGMPNFAMVIVYANASATLRSELVARYVCKVLNHMDAVGANVFIPTPPAGMEAVPESILQLNSGYLLRSLNLMPRNGPARPWRLDHDYLVDRKDLLGNPIDDGNLKFSHVDARVALEAAE